MIHRINLFLLTTLILVSSYNANGIAINKQADAGSTKQMKQSQQENISGYAPVNGLKMYYEIHGNGAPLVLIHGGGSTIKTTFSNTLPLLAQNYKVIAVELQAHGHTNDRGKPSSFEQDADDVAALLAYLKINKADFLGFSNGGSTAMQIGIRHPFIVNKLVIISAFYKREGMMPGFFKFMDNATLANMPMPLQTAYLEIPGNNKAGLQIMHDRDAKRMQEFKDWNDKDLSLITAPALLIVGDKDVVTTEHAVEMSHKIPNASLMILPGTHGSFIGEVCTVKQGSKMPALTVKMIEDFLN